jgi:hypothetical protein
VIRDRATEFGWNSEVLFILNIPEDPLNAAGELDNLLTNYGMIPIKRVRAFEETYIHLPIRAAQPVRKCTLNPAVKAR